MRNLGQVVAKAVREQRLALGMTQARLADRIGCSSMRVNDLEAGRISIYIDDLSRLCAGLGVTLVELLWGADPDDLHVLGLGEPRCRRPVRETQSIIAIDGHAVFFPALPSPRRPEN